jgi:hypothetical protein
MGSTHGLGKATNPPANTKQQQQTKQKVSTVCRILNGVAAKHVAISIDLGAALIGGGDLHISLGVDSVNVFLGGGLGGGEEAGITVGPAWEASTGSIVGFRTFTTRGYGAGFGGSVTVQGGSNGVMVAGGIGAVEGALVETGGGVDFNLPSVATLCR